MAHMNPQLMDRHSFFMLAPESGSGFRSMVERLAQTGIMLPSLDAELEEMNMATTYEQPGEEHHANINQKLTHVGRSQEIPMLSASIRLPENMKTVDEDWMAFAFAERTWFCRCARVLCTMVLGDAASRVLPRGRHVEAVYHALPRQMFEHLPSSSAGIRQWQVATEPRPSNPAASARLCIGFFKDRMSVGSVFSIPDEISTSMQYH